MKTAKCCLSLDRRIARGEVDDPVKEKKPNPKIRDDLLIQLAEKKRQNIAALRRKIIELEKAGLDKEVPVRKPVKLTPNHIRRQRAKMGIVSNGTQLFSFQAEIWRFFSSFFWKNCLKSIRKIEIFTFFTSSKTHLFLKIERSTFSVVLC